MRQRAAHDPALCAAPSAQEKMLSTINIPQVCAMEQGALIAIIVVAVFSLYCMARSRN